MAEVSSTSPATAVDATPLPKLTPAEFRTYNRLAVMMDNFHNHFRSTWTTMYTASSNSERPAGMSLRQFLNLGLEFCHYITMHHDIEEQHVFPTLAKKMPIFRNNELMKNQHKQIHAGLDKLQSYLAECRDGDHEYRASELYAIMESFNDVLWTHLNEEVVQLGAENMRKYWTLDDMARMRW